MRSILSENFSNFELKSIAFLHNTTFIITTTTTATLFITHTFTILQRYIHFTPGAIIGDGERKRSPFLVLELFS